MNIINYASRFPFNGFLDDLVKQADLYSQRTPAVNIQETAESYKIELSVPGFHKENLEISVDKDLLKVKGEVKKTTEAPESKYLRREFNGYVFEKSFHLPENIDVDKITATYEQGILNLNLPKLVEVNRETKKVITLS